jgi:hypothetical protein
MMEIRENDRVRVFVATCVDLLGRCGAVKINQALDSPKQSFHNNAYVPDLTTVVPLELNDPIQDIRQATGNFVYIGKISKRYHRSLRHLGAVEGGLRPDDMQRVVDEIFAATLPDKNIRIDPPIGWSGYAQNPNGLVSTTLGPDERYFGLHYDDFEGRELTTRDHARNRICINVGTSARGFSFWPIPMSKALETLKEADLSPTSSREVASLATARNYVKELITIILHPGEFYVAPTENVLHDGNTICSTADDFALTIRGNIFFTGFAAKEVINIGPVI